MKILQIIATIILIILTSFLFYIWFSNPKPTGKPSLTNSAPMLKTNKVIRQPAVAGQFYPSNPSELKQMITKFLNEIPKQNINQKPHLLIVPHAGYVFSGQTAAYAYQTIANQTYDTIIILGSSHNYPLNNLALYNGDAITTPLGEIAINKKLTKQLISADELIYADNTVHAPEHSLEVQIPFLQTVLKNNFQLVLGLTNTDDNNTVSSLAQTINSVINQNTLIIISSDLSHYPTYDDALYSDTKTLDAILTKNITHFDETIDSIIDENKLNLDTCACGASAIKLGMLIAAENNWSGQILHYSNSGDTPNYGDKNRVVGYGSIVFYNNERGASDTPLPQGKEVSLEEGRRGEKLLSKQEQQIALSLARWTLESAFGLTDKPFTDHKNIPIFSEKRGIFVTLHTQKNHALRGCIGLIEPVSKLGEGIMAMAKAAAFNDHRFSPLTTEEFANIEIEISVLTPPQKISNPEKQIELGKHGVIVRQSSHSGVFLPQVATDTGWSLEKFLSSLCSEKAGLPADCYLDPTTEIYTFETQVFAE